jgi:catechol 2,3-dioxygenase-like lactoylglutathione lyase family enzyme
MDKAIDFYTRVLPFEKVSDKEVWGAAFEHLSGVFGAKLHITNLGTKDDGIHVEFLEYLAPRGGRPFPRDTRSSDLWHWQTSFSAQRPEDLSLLLSRNRFDFISSGEVAFQENTLGFDNSFLVRDPDGHAVRLVQQ